MSTSWGDYQDIAYRTPFGTGLLRWKRGRLLGHRLPGFRAGFAGGGELGGRHRPHFPPRDLDDLAQELVARLTLYFEGQPIGFGDLDIPFGKSWTAFEAQVAASLSQVPYGQMIGYAELAMRAEHPRACRAVGNFLAKNPFPVILPCHRIVLSSGKLGNFSQGADWKKRLLELEGIDIGSLSV